MTFLDQAKERNIVSKIGNIDDKKEWWRLLEEGYVGIQTGNTNRIYFFSSQSGKKLVYSVYIEEDCQGSDNQVSDKENIFSKARTRKMVDENLRARRDLYVLKTEDIMYDEVRERIHQMQQFGKSPISIPTNQFNEELL